MKSKTGRYLMNPSPVFRKGFSAGLAKQDTPSPSNFKMALETQKLKHRNQDLGFTYFRWKPSVENQYEDRSSDGRQISRLYFIFLASFLILLNQGLFTGGQIFPFFSVILAVNVILIIFLVKYGDTRLETSGRTALRTGSTAASLPWILSVAGLGRFASTAFVVLNMLACSTSFSVLFLSGKRPKIGSFFRYCSVLSLLAAVAVLVKNFTAAFLLSADRGAAAAILKQ